MGEAERVEKRKWSRERGAERVEQRERSGDCSIERSRESGAEIVGIR